MSKLKIKKLSSINPLHFIKRMKIKTRIVLSVSLLSLAALVALLIAGSLTINGFQHKYYKIDNFKADSHAADVGTIISSNISIDEMKEEIAQYGYRLHVIIDGEDVDDDEFAEQGFVKSVIDSNLPDNVVNYITIEGITIVGYGEDEYMLIAVHDMGEVPAGSSMMPPSGEVPAIPDASSSGSDTQIGAFKTKFIIIGICLVLALVIISRIVAGRIAKNVLRPIDSLKAGAKRVASGNYSEPVVYEGEDELTSVVTAFNEMQKSLLEEKEKLAKYEQARTDLVTGISHDLRTPLTSVKGYLKGLRDGVADTKEKQERYIDVAYAKAGVMETLLDRLFFFSKLESGNLPLEKTKTDIKELFDLFCDETYGELSNEGITLRTEVEPGSHYMDMDIIQMCRVLRNLCDNARKHAIVPDRKLELSLRAFSENGREHITFTDNGPGVPEELLPKMFEEFWRGDEARGTKNGEGSGIGLYIVKYITEAHNGKVLSYNRTDNNSGLTIELIFDENGGDK